jgi:hypothetical protein
MASSASMNFLALSDCEAVASRSFERWDQRSIFACKDTSLESPRFPSTCSILFSSAKSGFSFDAAFRNPEDRAYQLQTGAFVACCESRRNLRHFRHVENGHTWTSHKIIPTHSDLDITQFALGMVKLSDRFALRLGPSLVSPLRFACLQ